MKLKLWGTRGSIPSPLRSQDIEKKIRAAFYAAAEAGLDLSDPNAIRAFISSLPYAIRGTAGGDTACLELRSGGNLFIFDCGSGMRQLGQELLTEEFGRGKGVAHIFMTHTHWDHMMGWPFFVPGFIPGNEFYFYSVFPDLEDRFRLQQKEPTMFPVSLDFQPAKIEFKTIQENSVIEIGQTRIRNMPLNHPGGCYAYRIEDQDGTLVYATDSEFKSLDPQETKHFVDFFQNADALIFDAMFSLRESYQKEDWGHSSAVAGADLATRAGVRRLLLFHHDPTYTDKEIWSLREEAEDYLKSHPERPPCTVIVAYDGLEIELWRDADLETRVDRLPEGTAIYLNGHLTGETKTIALETIEAAAAQAEDKPLVVDLSAVVRVDQEGLKSLLLARRRRRPLALSGLSPELRRTFARAGALDHFATFEMPHSALTALQRGSELAPGKILNSRYRIEEALNQGALGDFYRAIDQVTGRQVVIQLLCPSLGAENRKALMATAQTVLRLRHRLVASVLEVGQDGPLQFLVTEYLPGPSIHQLLREQEEAVGLPAAQAVRISSQIAETLEHAHSHNVVHGALSPENVFLADGSAKVTRFGIGRLELDKPLTELPAHMGQLDYLAPEQLQGLSNSPASDLYALGTMLYEMVTGAPPFAATTDEEDLIYLKMRQPPVPPRRRNPNISRSLEYLVLSLLKKSPGERPSDASAVQRILASLDSRVLQGPLLGRERLSRKLTEQLERVAQGESRFLMMQGQRGVGKSRLILSVVDQYVTAQPLTKLHGELFAAEDSAPYKIFVKALRGTLLALPAHQLTQLLNDLGDLARPLKILMPDLRPSLSALGSLHIESGQLESAICETIRLLTAQKPGTLILDGLQWADLASLRLLKQLAQREIPGLLIVGLYRSRDIDRLHPLHQALEVLDPLIDEPFQVTPLSPIDVHQMASALSAAQQVPPDFSLWLFSETQGNPLHIEQLVQVYLEGATETRNRYERITDLTLEEVVLRRLERLPHDALDTLRQASVLGHTFRAETLRSVLDQPESQILSHLASALQLNLILGSPSEDLYRFSHALMREVIYAEMLGGVRRRYYRRVARILDQRGVSNALDEKLDRLAHYFLRAGELDKAVAYLARASVRARQLCAYDVALAYIDQALKVVEKSLQMTVKADERTQRAKQQKDLSTARRKLEQLMSQWVSSA